MLNRQDLLLRTRKSNFTKIVYTILRSNVISKDSFGSFLEKNFSSSTSVVGKTE